ncbi:beta-galactosidase trimerization domain-containing protein [Rhizobium sp. BK251]|uniref:beta-galactosidase trimerization domain-containing protein n=1 Tax=Rhizobium sp. BK251 TaxID=2512125 RepID=UPI00105397AF|nr:beta-galactosidase trimerization domain-containing protein [Rhizobium sp. BK251]TCL64155.1 beta-galactosidase-like protein [Rhizobium sp. BK251]
MRFRQIHLDFHTSGLIPGIGSRFNASEFASAFKNAHVDSVTVFSKCHHGYSYHPTKVGETHPGLRFDLLRAQLDALHGAGINAPIYLTATWDELAAHRHPEWRAVSPEGGQPRQGTTPNGPGWAFLDFSTPYLDYLCAQTEEVMTNYPDGDGIFMDIAFQLPSVSASARDKMDAMGLDWTNPQDVHKFTHQSAENFYQRVRDAVHKHNPSMPLFFNSGHMRRGLRSHYADYYSHLEIESLPTAGWGYDHFPLSARYFDALKIPFLGMTGKFHFHWGEVGGYKVPEALVYECGAMLAHGARCSIGDHLHPTGQIDKSTMSIIAPAYEWVERREPWAIDTENRAEIALLSAEAASRPSLVGIPGQSDHRFDGPEHGAVRVLLEGKFAFDVVDTESDFSPYRLLILPDVIEVDPRLKAKIDAYAAEGGRVLLTGKSGIDPDKGFLFDVGAKWKGTSQMTGGDYLLPIDELRAGFVNDPLFTYQPSEQIVVTDGTSLGEVYDPYFDRRPQHFSGHVNAPSKPEASGFAAGSEKGNFTYLAHPIFSCYHQAGAVAMLEIAEKAINRALGRPKIVTTSLPRAGRVTVRSQPGERRDIVHLLHATPALRGNLRGANIQPIQDITTLHEVSVSLASRGQVEAVRIVPALQPLDFVVDADRVDFVVPEVNGHAMVEIVYA